MGDVEMYVLSGGNLVACVRVAVCWVAHFPRQLISRAERTGLAQEQEVTPYAQPTGMDGDKRLRLRLRLLPPSIYRALAFALLGRGAVPCGRARGAAGSGAERWRGRDTWGGLHAPKETGAGRADDILHERPGVDMSTTCPHVPPGEIQSWSTRCNTAMYVQGWQCLSDIITDTECRRVGCCS
jgi:hypothetical protein